MAILSVIYPVIVLGGMGLILGLVLGYFAKKFAVTVDPKVEAVRNALPGANCTGCGFAGCEAFAEAVVKGEAEVTGCPVGGAAVANHISSILGSEVVATEKTVAYIKCNGTCDAAKIKYDYHGYDDCKAAVQLAGIGSKGCIYGCIGLGSCKRSCLFGAIRVVDSIAVIDKSKCVSCGKCISTCPKNLIEIVPEKSTVKVACNSNDKGKSVKSNCAVGCIGCKLCEKACKFDAIHVTNQLAHIDYDKCTLCGECVRKCPTNAIIQE